MKIPETYAQFGETGEIMWHQHQTITRLERERDRLRVDNHRLASMVGEVTSMHQTACAERDRLRAQVEALKAALNDIKRHQEIIAGDAGLRGATWHIADKALREGE